MDKDTDDEKTHLGKIQDDRQAIRVLHEAIDGGMTFLDLRQHLDIARRFQPMTTAAMESLRMRFMPYAKDGRFDLFKSSDR